METYFQNMVYALKYFIFNTDNFEDYRHKSDVPSSMSQTVW